MSFQVEVPRAEIERICERYRVEWLAVFGSAIREDFDPDSDVDILVEFEAGHTPGLGFARLQRELSGILGRQVDLHTCRSLSRYFRDEVIQQSEVVYERVPQAS